MEISVIIPTYNREKELRIALNSLLDQSFKNFEVIVVDDGSIDNSIGVVEDYINDLTIQCIRIKHSGNIAHVRNVGLCVASGRYIAILDSDDWCDSERLFKQYTYLSDNEDIDILATWVNIVEDPKTQNGERLNWLYNMKNDRKEIIKRCLNDGCSICHSTVMMRKSVLDNLAGYDESMIICEDNNLWLRALNRGYMFDILQEKLVFRKIHNDSVTCEYDGSDKAVSYVIKCKLEYLMENGLLSKKNVAIWGVNYRNSILLRVLEEFNINISKIEVIDVYENLPMIEDNKYNLVTTYTSRDKVFDFLESNGCEIVKDYIYI